MDDNDLNGLFTRDLEALEMTIHSPMSAFIEMTMEGRGLPVEFLSLRSGGTSSGLLWQRCFESYSDCKCYPPNNLDTT